MIYTGQGYKYRANSHDYHEIIYLNLMLKQSIVGLEEENIRFHYNSLIDLVIQTYLIEKRKFKAVMLPYTIFAQ